MSEPVTSAKVDGAARWLAEQAEPPHPAVPALKSRFDLSAVEACKAIALAQHYRANPSRDDERNDA
ncbi:MAG TPA: hypothetical protein VGN93_13350 [Shinella sp.]|jgi:hypothetical protein|uniref:hypothetical protein n=1 Tax=Shinella sp. TaxID=1870904 RepID=UPI002E11B24D|nr:hypothetical protein [Shinella sp.]